MDTAEVMGFEFSPGALAMFVDDLASLLTDEEIVRGLVRARREVRTPKLILRDVLSRSGYLSPEELEQIEAIEAWEKAQAVVARFGWYTSSGDVVLRPMVAPAKEECKECHGRGITFFSKQEKEYDKPTQYVKPCVCRERTEVPRLERRLTDTVRRVGGWRLLKELEPEHYPFVRKDFLQEYVRWQQVELYESTRGGGMYSVGRMIGSGRENLEGYLDKILNVSGKKPSASVGSDASI